MILKLKELKISEANLIEYAQNNYSELREKILTEDFSKELQQEIHDMIVEFKKSYA